MNVSSDPGLAAFYTWLRTTPLPEEPDKCYTQDRLAYQLVTSRAHLSQVLAGRRPGPHTWRRLVRILPAEGLALLRNCSTWNKTAERAYLERAAKLLP